MKNTPKMSQCANNTKNALFFMSMHKDFKAVTHSCNEVKSFMDSGEIVVNLITF